MSYHYFDLNVTKQVFFMVSVDKEWDALMSVKKKKGERQTGGLQMILLHNHLSRLNPDTHEAHKDKYR